MNSLLNIPLFLASVAFISLSGVMMPGPVMAVTISKGRNSGNAGALIALGHGIIEIPLIILIFFGFAQFFSYEIVRRVIGLVGGLMLGFMGLQMFKTKDQIENVDSNIKFNSIFSGIITTGANPYFFLWWATIGSALIINSTIFGLVGFILFAIVHWLCDLIWSLFISKTVYRSQKFWNLAIHRIIFSICAIILIFFGIWFIYSSII